MVCTQKFPVIEVETGNRKIQSFNLNYHFLFIAHVTQNYHSNWSLYIEFEQYDWLYHIRVNSL